MSFPRRSCPIAAVFALALPNLRRFRDDHCPLIWRKLTPMEISRQHELGAGKTGSSAGRVVF
jgi:hypothetical protein